MFHARGWSRRSGLRLLAAAGAGIGIAGAARGAAAQATPAGHPLVGTWWVESDPPGGVTLLSTYHADGTYADGGPPAAPAPPGAPHAVEFFGSGRGVWAALDGRRAAVALAVYRSDGEGNTVGAFSSRGVVELDESGDAYRGAWTVDVLDAAGTRVDGFEIATRGRRMRLEPVGGAAATPAP